MGIHPLPVAPSLLRRLAAVFYDWLLLGGLMFAASLPVVWWLGGAPQSTPAQISFRVYLLALAYLFFCWFWTHGGQTLGMRAWRIKLVNEDGTPVGWRSANKRFFSAIFSLAFLGLGFLWVMHDREARAWHDRLSATRLIQVFR